MSLPEALPLDQGVKYIPGPDFFSCQRCGRLITKLEMSRKLHTGKVCPCHGMRYKAAYPNWYHWFLPKIWHFAYLRFRKLA